MRTPNDYQLSARDLHVTYRTWSGPGAVRPGQEPPHVTYQDPHRTLAINGKDVEVVKTAAGELITVRTVVTVDLGYTAFSFFVPTVQLEDNAPTSVPVHTVGITSMHRTPLAPPFGHGQTDSYSTVRLDGMATFHPEMR